MRDSLAMQVVLASAQRQADESLVTRGYCACGCGCWWYEHKGAGRKAKYVNAHHRRMHHWKLERARREQLALGDLGRGSDIRAG